MNRFLKKIVVGVSSLAICLCTFSNAFAYPTLLHENKISKNLSSGVVHESIKQFHSNGWWNINILRVNLNDQYTKIGSLFSNKGVSHKEKVTDMMKESGAIAGINGDFFANEHSSFPIGAVISDGKVVSTPAHHSNAHVPVFAIDKDKNPFMLYWDWEVKAINKNSGQGVSLFAINKDTRNHEEVIMYDSNWGQKTHGNKFKDMVEVVVTDNIVREVRVGKAPITIPNNGYVLCGRGKVKNQLINTFPVGTHVNLDVKGAPNFNNISMAVGGGSLLVKDGVRAKFDINIKGNHPRTAIGMSKDKKQLIMLTIDGRDKTFQGVSQDVLADMMIAFGAHDAINFDGGGSTTMAVKTRENNLPVLVNNPSDGSERKVINGVGIFDNAPIGAPKYITIHTDDSKMFVNTTRKFSIKVYDEYYHPLNVDTSGTTFSIEGINGVFNGNTLTANQVGTGTVKANFNGIIAEHKINVLSSPKEIITDINKLGIGVSSQRSLGNMSGKNGKGQVAKIDPNDINWEVVGNVGSVKNGVFYSSESSNSGAIVGKLGDAIKNILVTVGSVEKSIDELENLNSINHTSYPKDLVPASIEVSNESKVGSYSVKLNYDFTKTNATRAAYVLFGSNGIKLQDNPQGVGMWVYGNNDNSWLRGDIVDSKGQAHKIDFARNINWNGWKWVTADIPSNVSYPVTLQRVYAAQPDPNTKVVSNILIDGLKALYSKEFDGVDTSILPGSTKASDESYKQGTIKDNGYKFIVTFGIDNLNNSFKQNAANGIRDRVMNSKYAFFMGPMTSSVTQGSNSVNMPIVSGYQHMNDKDLSFIKIDNSKNGIRLTNPNQWLWLKEGISYNDKNKIVILLPKPVYGWGGFSDALEAELFHNVLSEQALKGKDIFVIYGQGYNVVDVKDGVRYIGINNPDLNGGVNLNSLRYLEFIVNDDDISYQYLPLFK
ncbi:exopolysaccharide biosynthesis protein [Gottschalkia purinilytica]|uniref:Exopolysaccharide biosynthesis protein n=1 Tax=Gottschalkia purinilytica TaxID=1503 RepID=A0A0L0WDX8_GOTPU|nr:phosphodiester glycosidase family protein [Gottschalkia purinilytica]KNF09683.1 exopolysaccharide biosynthesis protein [Gottschalkia purinilytica]